MTDDFAPGRDAARDRAEQREVEGTDGSAPLMRHSILRGVLLFGLALTLGFALMGFEMLASRYLYPYFGGGINTWASLIATVLVALMLGYLLGGALVDRTMSPRLCGYLLVIAGAYLFSIPLWVDPLFAWTLHRHRRRHGRHHFRRDHAAAAAAHADERVHAVRGAAPAHLRHLWRAAGRLRLWRLDRRQRARHAGHGVHPDADVRLARAHHGVRRRHHRLRRGHGRWRTGSCAAATA